jgi:hypothetical protein
MKIFLSIKSKIKAKMKLISISNCPQKAKILMKMNNTLFHPLNPLIKMTKTIKNSKLIPLTKSNLCPDDKINEIFIN